MNEQQYKDRRCEEIRNVLHDVLDNRNRIATYVEMQNMVIADFNQRRLEKMRRGLRGTKLRQSLLAHRDVFLQDEGSRTDIYYRLVDIDENSLPMYNAVYVSLISTNKGRLYFVRTSNLAHLAIFKGHFWDRYQERAALTGQRDDAILRLMSAWHRTWLQREIVEREMIFWWDPDTFEQLVLTPEGVGLGSAMRFPPMMEFLNPLAKYKTDYTAVALFNTFISVEMLGDRQKEQIVDILEKTAAEYKT